MPQLPNYTAFNERQSPQPQGGIAQVNLRTGQEDAAARFTAQASNDIALAMRVIDETNAKQDTLMAEDAYNRLQEQRLNLEMDEKDGFRNVQGSSAVGSKFIETYEQKFKNAIQQINDSLQNESQKKLFSQRAQIANLQYRSGLMQHQARETESFNKQIYVGTLDVEARNASVNWNNKDAIDNSLVRVDAAVRREGERNGWPSEMIEDELLKSSSKIHANVIGQALSIGNYEYAKDWFDKNREHIDPQTSRLVEKAVEDGTQKQLFNGYNLIFADSHSNRKELVALASSVLKDEKLDETRKVNLYRQIQSRIEVLDNKARIEQDRNERQVAARINLVSRLALNGVTIPSQEIEQLSHQVKGTVFERDFKDFVVGLQDQEQFGRLPPQQMAEELEKDLVQRSSKEGTLEDKQVLESRIQKRAQMYKATIDQLSTNPLSYAEERAGIDVPIIDLKNAEEIPKALSERAAITSSLNKTHGAALGVFRPQEAQYWQQILKSQGADDRAKTLNMIYKSTGDYPGVYSATMAQLAPGSEMTAFAGRLFGLQDVNNIGVFKDTKIKASEIAASILRGEDILRPPKGSADDTKGPKYSIKENDFALYFKKAAGKAFPSTASDASYKQYYEATKARYADLSHNEGDRTPEVNPSRVKDAFKDVTGGGTVKFGGVFGGTEIIPPFGVTEKNFKEMVFSQFEKAVDEKLTTYPKKYIRGAGLFDIGGARYYVLDGDKSLRNEKTGGRLIIDISGVEQAQKPLPTNKPTKKVK